MKQVKFMAEHKDLFCFASIEGILKINIWFVITQFLYTLNHCTFNLLHPSCQIMFCVDLKLSIHQKMSWICYIGFASETGTEMVSLTVLISSIQTDHSHCFNWYGVFLVQCHINLSFSPHKTFCNAMQKNMSCSVTLKTFSFC